MIRISSLAILATLSLQAVSAPQPPDQPRTFGTPDTTQNSRRQPDPPGENEPRVLQPGSPKPVAVPPFPRFDDSKCDSAGNLYFAVAGNTHLLGSLLEISHDASTSIAFAPPAPEKLDPLGEIGYRDFAVAPSGGSTSCCRIRTTEES